MRIEAEHFLVIVGVAIIFFIMGMIIGGDAALSSKKEWYQQGQESCKVCEVEKIKTEAANDTKA